MRQKFATAVGLQGAGRLKEAHQLCLEICEGDPQYFQAFHLGGILAHRLGRDDAASLIQRAVELRPDVAEIHNDLGVVLAARGRFAEASAAFARATAIKPNYGDAQINLASALARQGQYEDAARIYAKLLASGAKSGAIHLAFGNVLMRLRRPADALIHYEAAVAFDPNSLAARYGLARALGSAGRLPEAIARLEEVARLIPRSAEAHNNLGNAFRELGRLDEAVAHYETALKLQPTLAGASYNLGMALRAQARFPQARAAFARTLTRAPDLLAAKLALCMTELRPLYRSQSEIADSRDAYQRELLELGERLNRGPIVEDLADAVGAHQPFYLPYQGGSDRDLQARYGDLVCSIMAARYPSARLTRASAPERINVGVASGFLRHHSNWKIPVRGWLSQLDPRHFRLFGYHTEPQLDAETRTAAGFCERFVQGPLPLERWRQEILSDGLHVLIYPEIGMDKVCAQLAAQRLAPVQCASWGHPLTSGFPTIDFFLSSELMEPADGAEHYREKLVRLANLSIYYEPLERPKLSMTRAELGLRASATLFWSCQSLPKYLPQFDPLFARIAREAPDCQFTFIEFPGAPHLTELFKLRLANAFSAVGLDAREHCVVLPRLAPERFHAAMGMADVFLDSVGWSGCNSTLESLTHDLPIVTLRGDFMRGRHSAAILEMMGLGGYVTKGVDDYVALAVRLAREPQARQEFKNEIAANKHRVYRDRAAIASLEAFLAQAARSDAGSRTR
jgi:protein O-GlcNAc transferase